jgi:aldose 1-epimerase
MRRKTSDRSRPCLRRPRAQALMTADALTLVVGDSRCIILPSLGGSLACWTIAGQPMLRTASAEAIAAGDPLTMATFPLVPFSNRIGQGRFKWGGHDVTLTQNFVPEPHAIHGVGWQDKWTVSGVSDDAATLTFQHEADDRWPWGFSAEQRIEIGERHLALLLTVRNTAAIAVPLAFGHHPYFDQAGARLQFQARRVWMNGEDALPSEAIAPLGPFDFAETGIVEGRDIDHCFAGWSGRARVEWAERPLALDITTTPPLGAAVVYIPKDGDAFCFEPVPHINNALNMPGHEPGMPIIEPGASFKTEIMFRAGEQV